jgi:hypothetical protein
VTIHCEDVDGGTKTGVTFIVAALRLAKLIKANTNTNTVENFKKFFFILFVSSSETYLIRN